MKITLILVVAGTFLAIPAANADDAHIGVGVGPVGAGVTVGSGDHDRYERTKVIKEHEEPRDKTVIIKKEHREPREKVIVHEHD